MAARILSFLFLAAAFLQLTLAVAPTDEYRDADPMQNSYSNNHNLDPAVVDSSSFGLLWKVPFNAKELFYAKPLTFTPNGGTQLVFLASSQNWIRTVDAKTGAVINSRQVHTPFLQADIGCTDIPNTIGIIGTPTIDPNTEVVYFFSKTYIPSLRVAGDTGVFNGVYYFHAVDINTLNELPNYPILIDGSPADNDARKIFIGGTILQRVSLLQIGNFVYAGFGGHCDQYNYTGTIIGIDVSKAKIATNWAVESGPNSLFTTDYKDNAGSGAGGVWQAGMGLSTDGASRLFFATGNGAGRGENQGVPASGQSGCRTLGEAVINLAIDSTTGKLSLIDYFQPYDYVNMDGGDQDFGSGGVALLDPTVFKGTGVSQMAVTTGKNGKIYLMNGNNLGGFKQGPGQTDQIVQTIVTNQAVFGGVGSYPLEGGYIYSTPVGNPTSAYKLGFTSGGVPQFSYAGATPEKAAGRVGPGIPSITTYKGQAGTAIMWLTDPDAGLRAWYAVPQSDGTLKRIKLPQTGGNNKFQRPAFGDSRLYTTDANGNLYCLGSPVNLPLNCTSPVQFGSVALGATSSATVQCTALIGINQISGISVTDAHFEVDQSTIPKGAIARGASFQFNVTWDLVNTTVSNAANASYGNTTPGVKSAALTITTVNSVGGYTTSFPISLTGNQVSSKPFLSLTPQTVDFGGLVLGIDGDDSPTATLSFTIANLGSTDMIIKGYAYSDDTDDDGKDYTNATYIDAKSSWDLGEGFTAAVLPAIGSVIKAGSSQSVPTTFAPEEVGGYLSYFNVWSTGGAAQIILEGSASTAPVANFSISTSEGGWLPGSNLIMDFGTVAPGDTATRQIRICNQGGSVLTITKSKPPLGDIRALAYGIDLHETQQIAVNDCAYGTVVFNPGHQPPNQPDATETNEWTLNVDDLGFGVHVVEMTGVVHTRQVGPTYTNGTARYQYLGCYKDNVAGRILPSQLYTDAANNTNQECQTAGVTKNVAFIGTEYAQECWGSNKLPSASYYTQESDGRCTTSCPGDAGQSCGGVGGGGYISIYYDTTKYTVTSDTYNASASSASGTVSTGPAAGPITVNSTGPYQYVGCYSEGTNGRALTGLNVAPPAAGGSVEYCSSQCAAKNFKYFGVEYSNECFCGNTLGVGSALVAGTDPTKTGCSAICGGNSSEYCGGNNRLNLYILSSAVQSSTSTTSSATSTTSTIGDISSTTDASSITTTSAVTTTASTTSSALTSTTSPAGPTLCPAANGLNVLDTNGNQYNVHCSSDSSVGSYDNAQAATSYLDCMTACDTANTKGCLGFVYVGAANGDGNGICYLKKSMGTYNTAGSNFIAAVKNNTISSSSTTTTSTTTLVPTTSTTSLSTTASTSTNTSTSTDSTTTSIPTSTTTSTSTTTTTSSTAASSTTTSSDSASTSTTTTSTTAVPTTTTTTTTTPTATTTSSDSTSTSMTTTSDSKSTSMTTTSTTTAPTTTTTTTTTTSTTTSFTSDSTTTTPTTTTISTITTTSDSTTTSTTTITTTTTTASTPSATFQPIISCPTADGTNFTASSGAVYNIECGIDHQGGDIGPGFYVNTFNDCINACDNTAGCVDVALSGKACYLKKSVGAAVKNGVWGARLVVPKSSTTTVTTTTALSTTSSTSTTTSTPFAVPTTTTTTTASVSTTILLAATTTPSSTTTVGATSTSTSTSLSTTSATFSSMSSASTTSSTSSTTTSSIASTTTTTTTTTTASTIATTTTASTTTTTASTSTLTTPASQSTTVTSLVSITTTKVSTTTTSKTTTTSPVYTNPPMIFNYTNQGCYNDSVAARALPQAGFYGSKTNNMTLEKCATFCKNYIYWGVEYGQECYCSNTLQNNSRNQTASFCKMPCPGDSTQWCGAGGYMNLYKYITSTTTTTNPGAMPTSASRIKRGSQGRRGRLYFPA